MILERLVTVLDVDDSAVTRGMNRAANTVAAGARRIEAQSQGVSRGLAAVAGGVEGNFSIVHRTFDKVEQSAGKAHISMGRLSQELLTATRAAVGFHPALGQIGFALGSITLGHAVMTGALLGLGTLALAFEHGKAKADDYAKAIDRAVESIKKLGQSEGIPNFDLRQSIAGSQGRIELLREQIAPDFARLQAFRGRLGGETSPSERIAVQAGIDEILKKIGPQLQEIAQIQEGIGAANRIMQKEAEEEKKKAEAAAAATAELTQQLELLRFKLALLGPGVTEAAIRLGAVGQAGLGKIDVTSRFGGLVRPGFLSNGKRILGGGETQPGRPSGLWNSISSGASSGWDQVKSLFNPQTIVSGAIGGVLTGGISTVMGLVGGKLLSGLSGLFSHQSEAQKRLQSAIEANTRALGASSAFLARRVKGTGLGDFAGTASKSAQDILDQIAVGEFQGTNPWTALISNLGLPLSGDPNAEFGVNIPLGEQKASGMIDKLLKALGIDPSGFTNNEELLRAFAEGLDRAGFGLDALAESADKVGDALRNVPSGFKVALARFNATVGRGVGGATGSAPSGVTITGNIYVQANSTAELERQLRQKARRGGSYPIRPAYGV